MAGKVSTLGDALSFSGAQVPQQGAGEAWDPGWGGIEEGDSRGEVGDQDGASGSGDGVQHLSEGWAEGWGSPEGR